MGSNVAPAGTVTVKLEVVPIVTVAFTAPKRTMLLEDTELKFVPVIITPVPNVPLEGVKEEIVGCAAVFINRPFLHCEDGRAAVGRECRTAEAFERPEVLRSDGTFVGRGGGQRQQHGEGKRNDAE